MAVNEQTEFLIERLNPDGCGYTADGQIAVSGALTGETVIAVPVARKRKRRYFRTIEVLDASAERVVPLCSAADYCGGCSFQHLDHEAQLRLKESRLRELLEMTPPHEWLAPLAGRPEGYRSKARLGVRFVEKKGRTLVGFREKMKPYIAETDRCPILQAPFDDLLEPLATLIESLSVGRHIPQVELAAGDEDFAMIFRHLLPMDDSDHEALRHFGERHGVIVYLQPGGMDTTRPLDPLVDAEPLTYQLPRYDLQFSFGPHDFTQVNLPVNRLMVDQALALLAPQAGDHVLDAFCGIGNFSLALARSAGQVTGMEQSVSGIDKANRNAVLNGIKNASFQVVDLHAKSSELPDLTGFNKVLLDPPRSGAEELVKRVASMDIERVVYVSCNPETLARDAEVLVAAGFDLRSAGIIDMFPHTTHVESIALFERSEPARQSA